MSKRATIHLEEELHRALRLKALETGATISELVNDAVRRALAEDLEDLSAFADRVSEPSVSFETAVRNLRRDGKMETPPSSSASARRRTGRGS